MLYRAASAIAFAFLLTSCSRENFVLTDDSATDRLMKTQYVADLKANLPCKLICFVEGSTSTEKRLYLGEDHDDHTVRLRECRVTIDGNVWVNQDPLMLEDQWALIK